MSKKLPKGLQKLAARLAAVQALYDMDLTDHNVRDVIGSFNIRGATAGLEDENITADPQLFADIVRGVTAERKTLDDMISSAGNTKRAADRYETLMRAILRAAAYEIWHHKTYDCALLISNYLSVTGSFYDRAEVGLVNGVLDALAKSHRSDSHGEHGKETDLDPSIDPLDVPIDGASDAPENT